MAPSFLLLHVITNEKFLKFAQIGRLLSASRASPQKHVPTTLVVIPVDIYIYTLSGSMRICGRGRLAGHSRAGKWEREDMWQGKAGKNKIKEIGDGKDWMEVTIMDADGNNVRTVGNY